MRESTLKKRSNFLETIILVETLRSFDRNNDIDF